MARRSTAKNENCMRIPRRRKQNMNIDLSPLIDCVFQLLIFFMLSSSLLIPNIKMTLPQAATTDETTNPEIVVSIDAEGKWYLNASPIQADQLKQLLPPLVQASQDKIVSFQGDQKMQYDKFVQALDAARQSGAIHMEILHDIEGVGGNAAPADGAKPAAPEAAPPAAPAAKD